MASSKVMASTSPTNPDLPRQSSIHSLTVADLQCDQSKSFGSMNMDELLKNIYGDSEAFPSSAVNGGDTASLSRQASLTLPKTVGNKTVDEVWKEIVEGSGGGGANREPEMTLEDFLTKAGAVSEEDVRIPVISQAPAGFGADSMMNAAQFQAPPPLQNETGGYGVDSVGFGNGIDGRMVAVAGGGNGGGGGRGKRRTVEEPPMDKATQQKQRRMIKNRESAARSRERKQAYTVELESLVTQLEEENSRLLREELTAYYTEKITLETGNSIAEQSKERFKQSGRVQALYLAKAKLTYSHKEYFIKPSNLISVIVDCSSFGSAQVGEGHHHLRALEFRVWNFKEVLVVSTWTGWYCLLEWRLVIKQGNLLQDYLALELRPHGHCLLFLNDALLIEKWEPYMHFILPSATCPNEPFLSLSLTSYFGFCISLEAHGELDSCCGEAKTTTSSSKSEFHVTGRCSLIYGLTIKMEETGFLSPVSEAELEGFLYKKKDRKKKKGMGPMFVFGGQLLV
ncbi:hypothetical protein TEA_024585 [Camellia sinensis var. sinensis]|uniref:BZIP domain-containing protein n=1 Tax=Camellia sinensis var. sinensis TaxID=542762 RepID=A0A4V3WN01_CAMSN|nr:hypothetical protein TEA_024585 [Camellia sinensis var. sinensis]